MVEWSAKVSAGDNDRVVGGLDVHAKEFGIQSIDNEGLHIGQ